MKNGGASKLLDVLTCDNFDNPLLSRVIFFDTDDAGRLEVVRCLLKHVQVDRRNKHRTTPLIFAAMHGRTPEARLLIAAKANIEACDAHGWTPLRLAAYMGHESVSRALLEAGAEIDSGARDNTALVEACAGKHKAVARLLLNRGACISKYVPIKH